MKRITILAATLFALSGLQAQTGIDGVLRNIETNNKELQANAQLIASQKLETRTDNNLPDPTLIDHIEEPMVKADIMVPKEYVGNIMEICQDRRGRMLNMEYITENRVNLHYDMPLNEVIYDFFDALKSKTRGYGSLD